MKAMGTLRDLQFALQLKIEELRQRDTLIDELELELDAKDDLIRRLQGELDRMRVSLGTPGSSAAGCLALRNSSQRIKRRAVVAEPPSWDEKQPPQPTASSHSKSPESQELIRGTLMENGFTKHLERGQILAIVDCMYATTVSQGSCVIREGENASLAYVIEEGKMEVTKSGHKLQMLEAGALFGELALLHNHTRSTTVTAVMNCKLWVIDRLSFQSIMLKSGLLRISQSLDLLRSAPFFRSLPEDALIKASDALEECHYGEGDYIIRHGSPGDSFFIVSQGQVKVTERRSVSDEPTCLSTLSRGDWFGERALRGEESRIVSVMAAGDVTCLVIERDSFRKLMGNLEDDNKIGRDNKESKARCEEKEEVSFPPDTCLGDLQVICCLGEGQFSTVELVHFKGDLRRQYTLKIIRKHAVLSSGQQGRLQTERRIMLEANCPFIVRLHKTFRDADCLYMLLEACLGGELWTLLRERGTFDDATTHFYTACVAEALSYLHSRGIVHRDLRPENIHLDQYGYAKLVGFGCAQKIGSRRKCWTFCGSTGYVAPEMILCKGHTTSVDYWALGVFIYEMLSGSPPFSASDPMKTYTAILQGIDAVEFPKPISKAAANLIKRLCRNNPSERLGTQRNGVKDIQRHKWFDGFDWEAVRKRTITPPILPCVHHPPEYRESSLHHDDNGNSSHTELPDWDKDF
ncbi:cGMP-dependent protein kinase 1 isoform X1 [Alosa sapidissima]|uniref:cGMP-dependent protein kinase 1 isoform X1 n=2 Tax=Alosa sapidissima TaxID=34773 RepID=UPI001C0A5DF9|nr:cGMP-dependent protein kinase 1 isoform X1 [Alosa sapidissima]